MHKREKHQVGSECCANVEDLKMLLTGSETTCL